MQNSLLVQVLRSPILAALLHGTPAAGFADRFAVWVVTRVGRRMRKFNRIRQMAPMCPRRRTRYRRLSNSTEPSVYGGDAPYAKLL